MPRSDYAGNYANASAAIYRDLARSQAEAKLRSGQAWAGALGEIGQTIAGLPGQLADKKRADQQSQLIEEQIRIAAEEREEHQVIKQAMGQSYDPQTGTFDKAKLSQILTDMGGADLVPRITQGLTEMETAYQGLKNAQQQGQLNEGELREKAFNYLRPGAVEIVESNFDPLTINTVLAGVEFLSGQEDAGGFRKFSAQDPKAFESLVRKIAARPPMKVEAFNLSEGQIRQEPIFGPDGNPVLGPDGQPTYRKFEGNSKPQDPQSLEQQLAAAVASRNGAEVSRIRNEMMRNAAATRAPQQPTQASRSWAYDPTTKKTVLATDDEIMRGGLQQPPTADMRNKESGKAVAAKAVDAVRALGENIFTKVGPAQRATAIKRGAEAVFGTDPEFRTYQDSRMALAGTLAVEQQGSRVSDADVKALWLPMVPDAYRDTKESYQMKWDLIDAMRGVESKGKTGQADEERAKALIKKYGGGR